MTEQRRATTELNAAIEGKTFVVTGTLTQFTQDEIHEKIKALGGKASGSISAKIDYLIAGSESRLQTGQGRISGCDRAYGG